MLLYNQQPHLPPSNKRNYGHLPQQSPKPSEAWWTFQEAGGQTAKACQGRKHPRDFSVRPAKPSGYCWIHLTWPDTACPSALKGRHQPCSTAQGGTRNPLPAHAGHLCPTPSDVSPWPQNHWGRHALSTWLMPPLKAGAPQSQLLLVWLPPLSTWSAPEWAFSITNLRITTAALVVILPDLAVMPPLSQLIWDPHCSSIHPLGHFSPLQLLLKPLLPYVKWDSLFYLSFQKQGRIWS